MKKFGVPHVVRAPRRRDFYSLALANRQSFIGHRAAASLPKHQLPSADSSISHALSTRVRFRPERLLISEYFATREVIQTRRSARNWLSYFATGLTVAAPRECTNSTADPLSSPQTPSPMDQHDDPTTNIARVLTYYESKETKSPQLSL
jgi:hypothetical protein